MYHIIYLLYGNNREVYFSTLPNIIYYINLFCGDTIGILIYLNGHNHGYVDGTDIFISTIDKNIFYHLKKK